jgi:hypothetical protein
MGHPPAHSSPTLTEVQTRFAAWRKTRQHRSRIPEELWAAAVKLSNKHSIHRISKALKLSYTDLKERIEKSHPVPETIKPTPSLDFIPIDIAPTQPAECIVEMEHRNGNKMRMHFKGNVDLDLRSFAEAFWSGKG